MKKLTKTYRISENIYAEFEKLCRQQIDTPSSMVRWLVKDWTRKIAELQIEGKEYQKKAVLWFQPSTTIVKSFSIESDSWDEFIAACRQIETPANSMIVYLILKWIETKRHECKR